MARPTKKQLDAMNWAFKFVGLDLCTPDHRGGRHRYHLDAWNTPTGDRKPEKSNDPCPQFPGDGLCVAKTLTGAQSGGMRLGASVMLTVGYLDADVLADSTDKVRVSRLYVGPDPIDPVQLVLWSIAAEGGSWADLYGANLSRANLSRADLSGANLSRANLSRADLSGANLSRADLSGANLSGANLSRADLYGANLSGANLYGADLSRADLSWADLSRADLSWADLSGANLSRADLSGANLSGANLSRANLSRAKGDSDTVLAAGWTVNASGLVVMS